MPNKNKLSTDSFGSVIHTPFVWVKRNMGAMVALALMCILLSVTTDSFLCIHKHSQYLEKCLCKLSD